MRRPRQLLRDISNSLYYKAPGEWTPDPEQAQHFPELQELITACERSGIRDAEVVEHFPSGHMDFCTPVRPPLDPPRQ